MRILPHIKDENEHIKNICENFFVCHTQRAGQNLEHLPIRRTVYLRSKMSIRSSDRIANYMNGFFSNVNVRTLWQDDHFTECATIHNQLNVLFRTRNNVTEAPKALRDYIWGVIVENQVGKYVQCPIF